MTKTERQIIEAFCWSVTSAITAEQEAAYENSSDEGRKDSESYWLGVVDGLYTANSIMWSCAEEEPD